MTFQPYNHEEIEAILNHRVGRGQKICDKKGTFGLISRKVASVSGDLRKALELVRRAIEIAVETDAEILEYKHASLFLYIDYCVTVMFNIF